MLFSRLSRLQAKSSEPWIHVYKQTLTSVAVVNGKPQEQSWILRGRVKTSIRPEANVVQFGTVSVRQTKIEQALKLTASEGIDRIECDGGPSWLTVTCDPSEAGVLVVPQQTSDAEASYGVRFRNRQVKR